MNNPDPLPKFNELTEDQKERVKQLKSHTKLDDKGVLHSYVKEEQAILIVLASELIDSPQRKIARDLLFDKDWYKFMFRSAMRLQSTPNPDMAKAIVSEAYFSLQDKIREFSGRANFTTWCHEFIRYKVREESKKNDFTVKFNEKTDDYNDSIRREAEIAKETGKPTAPKKIKLPITKIGSSIEGFDDESGESNIDFFDRNAKTPEELLELKQEMEAKFDALSEVVDNSFAEFLDNKNSEFIQIFWTWFGYARQDRVRMIDDKDKSEEKEKDGEGRVTHNDIADECGLYPVLPTDDKKDIADKRKKGFERVNGIVNQFHTFINRKLRESMN